ncbi:hypothetical protein [Ureibacillus sinduriensis]|uniref:hypothetical protein n=1 Tax=Ureibacillus sinduriensis TaxID=561440 RepID=UPI000AB031A8|nr:hypothetical protein [Ureibacillus sinduriensis]
MKRGIVASIAYMTTGIGIYHTFFGTSAIFGMLFLIIGLVGILYDIFYEKLDTV